MLFRPTISQKKRKPSHVTYASYCNYWNQPHGDGETRNLNGTFSRSHHINQLTVNPLKSLSRLILLMSIHTLNIYAFINSSHNIPQVVVFADTFDVAYGNTTKGVLRVY